MAALKLVERRPSIKTLDDLFREYIRKRDQKCVRCGRDFGKLEVAHFYSRAKKSTRWDSDNACLLCFNCHYQWAHREPAEFADWWKLRLGDKYNALTIRAHGVIFRVGDYPAVKLHLQGLIEGLNHA